MKAWSLKTTNKTTIGEELIASDTGWINSKGTNIGCLPLSDFSHIPVFVFEFLTSKVIKNKRTEIEIPKWIFKYESFYLIKGSQQILMQKNSKNEFENSFKTYKGI